MNTTEPHQQLMNHIQNSQSYPEDIYRIEKRDHRFFSSESFSSPAKRKHLQDIESTLMSFIEKVMSEDETIRRLVFLPAGIPGMGKTTIGRFLEQASLKLKVQTLGSNVKVQFKRVSFDHVFTDLQQKYFQEHPDVDFQAAFDIIRGQAEEVFNQQIREACVQSQDEMASYTLISAGEQSQNYEKVLDILYVDKNNTPDKWEVMSSFLTEISHENQLQARQKTILIVPTQTDFDYSLCKKVNAICPQFVYECLFRIFNRKNHCLSSSIKPKAVEVVLKFVKLYDNIDFKDQTVPLSYFDHFLKIEFVHYNEQTTSKDMIRVLVEAYNETPENFVPPSDETINKVLNQLEKEIADKEGHRVQEMEYFNQEIKTMTNSSAKDDEYFH
ncbi:UNKNOWN [Stylonychia lemnae]|uniref:Uncharacterized protein n=1 Tax=Stylonychia lemnae TaxID=5949 RepID=A0A077ZQW3_STYLE|nr:UNKNOWN [Stylonychia lemnae]|eukprot:CDW71775.1 UNKNOWN [Stylonychia lemnae]